MSTNYPFAQITVLACAIGLSVGCSSSIDDMPAADTSVDTSTEVDISEGLHDGHLNLSDSHLFIAMHPDLNLSEDAERCELNTLKILDLKQARPVDIEFISSSDIEYEIYLDIVDVELKTTVGTITQFETGVAEVDLTGKLLPDRDYVVDGELLDFTHDDLCVIGGRAHFTDLYQD